MSATVAEKRPTVGRLLRSAREPQPRTTNFKVLWFVVIAANLFGLLMILSASSVTALYQYGTSWYRSAFRRSGLSLGVAQCFS